MSGEQPKLTKPFPGNVKPAYVGGYLYTYSFGYEFDAWWDGRQWIVNDKKHPSCIGLKLEDLNPRDSWRGLAVQP